MDRSEIQTLGGGSESLRGYFQSVRPATGGLLLNVNVTHNVFLEPESLERLYPKLGTGSRTTLQTKLKNMRIRVTHLEPRFHRTTGREIPRVKILFGLAHPQNGKTDPHPPKVEAFGAGPKDVSFWLSAPELSKSGDAKSSSKAKSTPSRAPGPPLPLNTYISVFDYFKKRYPAISWNINSPVVNVGNRDHPSYLPAEVCMILPGQTIKRRLSPDQTAQMITFACRRPWENANSIVSDGKAVLGLRSGSNPTLAKFGLAVGDALITVAARVLNPPAITYKDVSNLSREKKLTP